MIWGPPDGPLNAKLLVVGRDYGWHEQNAKPPRPFIGPAGFYLNRALLEEAGLPRSLVRVTNVVNTRPDHDDWNRHLPGSIERGTTELLTELDRFASAGGELIL